MTTWVLLRGLIREKRHWGEFLDLFQASLGTQQVIALDLPGNGSLHELDSPATVEAMAEHCRTQLLALGYPPPYRVLALSLGAMVAVAWSEHHPQEVEKMVLINTSLAPLNPFYQRLRPINYLGLIRNGLFGSVARKERRILELTSNLRRNAEDSPMILARWIDYAREYPVSRANSLRQLLAAVRFRAPLSTPKVPVLLVAAEHDNLVDAQCSVTLAQRWQCELRLHASAGHDLPLDDGAWVVQRIKIWLTIPEK